tara:strand:+ start:707 stop:880 length:174 start_codon:yes stop_codon:yes gene_type:complete
MKVTAAKYQKGFIGSDNVSIIATIDGEVCYVPLNTENRHYQAILEWVDAGNSIEAAD